MRAVSSHIVDAVGNYYAMAREIGWRFRLTEFAEIRRRRDHNELEPADRACNETGIDKRTHPNQKVESFFCQDRGRVGDLGFESHFRMLC